MDGVNRSVRNVKDPWLPYTVVYGKITVAGRPSVEHGVKTRPRLHSCFKFLLCAANNNRAKPSKNNLLAIDDMYEPLRKKEKARFSSHYD